MKKTVLFLGLLFIASCQSGPQRFKTNLRTKKLPNGIEVLSFKDKSLPSFKVMVWSPHGYAYEPGDELGVTRLMAQSISEGSKSKGKSEILKAFSALGSSFNASTSLESTVFSASSLTSDSYEVAKLFTEVLLEPSFDNKALLEMKQKTMALIKRSADSPPSLAAKAFNQKLFEGHGYSRSGTGLLSTVAGIRQAAVLRRYAKVMSPKDLKIVLIGNWTENAEAYMLSRFTDLESSFQESSLDRVEVPLQKMANILYHKKGLQQANVNMGVSSISRDGVDYEALKVGLFILGGTYRSRLGEELRIKRSLTYGVHSSLNALKDGGLIEVSGSVRHDKLKEFVVEAKKILSQAASEGVTQEELDKAKAIIKGQFPRGVETKESEASAYLGLVSAGVSGDELYTYLNKVMELSLDDVNDALRKYLRVERLNTVILANKYKVPARDLKALKVQVLPYTKIDL